MQGTGDWTSGSKQRVDRWVEVDVEVGFDRLEGVDDNDTDEDDEGVGEAADWVVLKIVDGKLKTYVVTIDQPARFEARVIVSGNSRETAVEVRNLTLTVSTRVVVPLYAVAVLDGLTVDDGTELERAMVPKQPRPTVP